MRVLIIPEDFKNDQYILKPIFRRLFQQFLGKPNARVQVCQDPKLGSVYEAMKLNRISEIVDRYTGMIDIFLLCIDRDGEAGRRESLDNIESEFADASLFLAVNAWEEIETWVLAGLKLPKELPWAQVRDERDVKERYFEPFASQRGLSDSPGGGRKPLAEEAARHIGAIRQKCPEDFDDLALRLSVISG